MKVVCINNNKCKNTLTINKMYDVISECEISFSRDVDTGKSIPNKNSTTYLIKCDNGFDKHFDVTRFRKLNLCEERTLTLNKILD